MMAVNFYDVGQMSLPCFSLYLHLFTNTRGFLSVIHIEPIRFTYSALTPPLEFLDSRFGLLPEEPVVF